MRARPSTRSDSDVDRLVELLALTAQRAQHGVEVVDDLPDQLIAVGQCVGHRRGLVQKRPDRVALSLKRLDQLTGQRVDLLGSSARNSGRKPPISASRSSAGCGPVERDRVDRA